MGKVQLAVVNKPNRKPWLRQEAQTHTHTRLTNLPHSRPLTLLHNATSQSLSASMRATASMLCCFPDRRRGRRVVADLTTSHHRPQIWLVEVETAARVIGL